MVSFLAEENEDDSLCRLLLFLVHFFWERLVKLIVVACGCSLKACCRGFDVDLSTAPTCAKAPGLKREVFLGGVIQDHVGAVDVVDVLVSKFVPSTPGEHLAFSGITCTLGILVSTLIFLLRKVFLSFLILQRRELNLRVIFCSSFCTNLPQILRCSSDLQKSLCGEASRCFPHYRRIGWTS